MRQSNNRPSTYLTLHAHSIVDGFFNSCPQLPFLQDRQITFKLFHCYLKWEKGYIQGRTPPHWKKTILESLFFSKYRSKNPRSLELPLTQSLKILSDLLRFYLYHHSPSLSLEYYLQACPHFSQETINRYHYYWPNKMLPSFSEVYHKLSPLNVASCILQEPPHSRPIIFSCLKNVSRKNTIPMESKLNFSI